MVDKAIVLEVVLHLHVLVQLLLRVQSARQAPRVHALDVDATQRPGALGLPLLDLAGCAHGCLRCWVPSWSSTLSLFWSTHCVSEWYAWRHLVVGVASAVLSRLNSTLSLYILRALLLSSIVIN